MGVSENGVYPLMVVPLGKRINYQIFVVPYIQTNPNILDILKCSTMPPKSDTMMNAPQPRIRLSKFIWVD